MTEEQAERLVELLVALTNEVAGLRSTADTGFTDVCNRLGDVASSINDATTP